MLADLARGDPVLPTKTRAKPRRAARGRSAAGGDRRCGPVGVGGAGRGRLRSAGADGGLRLASLEEPRHHLLEVVVSLVRLSVDDDDEDAPVGRGEEVFERPRWVVRSRRGRPAAAGPSRRRASLGGGVPRATFGDELESAYESFDGGRRLPGVLEGRAGPAGRVRRVDPTAVDPVELGYELPAESPPLLGRPEKRRFFYPFLTDGRSRRARGARSEGPGGGLGWDMRLTVPVEGGGSG